MRGKIIIVLGVILVLTAAPIASLIDAPLNVMYFFAQFCLGIALAMGFLD